MTSILDHWMNGEGIPDTVVIDGHIHIGEWPHATTFYDEKQAVRESLVYMDSHGIDAICAVSGGYIFGMPDYHLGNDFLLTVWKQIPDRMIPFMEVNPNDTRNELLRELNRMYDTGIRCIKLINSYQGNYPGDGPNLMTLYEFAAEHQMLVFNHAWARHEIQAIASQFTGINFIFAHYTGGFQDEVLLKFPNVYANIWNYGRMGWLNQGIERVGAHKFMMGSDGFLNCLSVGIGPVVFAPVSDFDKRMILGATVARLLDLAGALPACLKRKISDLQNTEPIHPDQT